MPRRPPARDDPRPASPTARLSPVGAVVVGWLVPGAAHLTLGDVRRGAVCTVVLLFMFVAGLGFGGRLFPFQVSEPLVFLAALAEWAVGVPRLVAVLGGFGRGDVVASTYEYGNTFLIAAGLLNVLVLLDAVDRVTGRKRV